MNPEITKDVIYKDVIYDEYTVYIDGGGIITVYAIDYDTAVSVAKMYCNSNKYAGFTVKG